MVTVTSLDELAHRAEVEAEVLRSISHLRPDDACQFLLDIISKIRRTHEPVAPVAVKVAQAPPAPAPAAAPETAPPSPEVTPTPIPLPPSSLTAPGSPPPASRLATRSTMPRSPTRTEVILRLLRERGEMHQTALYLPVAEIMGEKHELRASKSRTASTIWQLVNQQKTLRKDEITGRIRVAA